MTSQLIPVIIIGGGPAGASAALYLARAGQQVLLVENGAGALARAHKIENFYGTTATGMQLYNAGLAQVRALGADVITDEVVDVQYTDCFTVTLKKQQEELRSRCLLLATGTKNVTLSLQGLKEFAGKGVSYCALCDGFFFRNKRVAVVGSGAYALHEAEYLQHLAAGVTILTNGGADSAVQAAGFDVNPKKLAAVFGETRLQGVRFADGSELALDGLFIALGTADSTDIARKLGAQLSGRFIRIDGNGATNIPGLFAAGDCTGGLLQVAKAVHEGAAAALAALQFLRQQV